MTYILEEKHIKFMANKLKGGAAWRDQLQITRRRQSKPPVMTWRHMKLLQGRFLLPDYQYILYNQFEQYIQGTRTLVAYTEEFYRLSSRCNLSVMEEQISKYINGLKYSIQECEAIQDVFSVDEAQNKVMKIEML